MNNFKCSKQVLVSINCFVYNHGEYLRQCLDGFIMQKTNFAFEAIVHDDVSTDDSVAIIREYAEKYPDIIKPIYETENQFSKRDGSIYRIMNNAVHPSAKYIAMCEGDDYWIDENKLQKQVDFLEQNKNYSMVCSNRFSLNSDGTLIENKYKEVITKKDILEGIIPATQTMLYRNYPDLIEQLNLFAGFYSGDWIISYILSKKGAIYVIQDFLAVYRAEGNGVWSKLSNEERAKKYVNGFYDFHKMIGFPDKNIFIRGLTRRQMYVLKNCNKLNISNWFGCYKLWSNDISFFKWGKESISWMVSLFFNKVKSYFR